MTEYTDYKESGAGWLGIIPKEWSTCLLKYIFSIEKRIAGTDGYTVLSVTQSGIRPKDMSAQGQFAQDYSKYQLVYPGDFAMNHMDLLTGWVDISMYEGVTSPDYRVFVNTDKARYVSEYYKYIFQYCYTNRVFYGMGQGVSGFGRWRLPANMFLNFRLPVPSFEEQIAISKYLKMKTLQIDDIISEIRVSIDEYKQLKASTIYEAVTKGLNPNVEMVDSGNEDIGKIPVHWRMGTIKNAFEIVCGATPTESQENWGGDIRWIGPADMPMFGAISEGKRTITNKGYNSCGTTLVPKGSIVLSTRAPIGKICIATEELCTNQGCKSLVPKTQVNTKYYAYYLFSITERMQQDGTGTTFKELSTSKLKSEPMPIVPIEEQHKITVFLDNKCAAIDALVLEKESLIAELELYKKSLIYEVVTGKRKVV